MTRIVICGGPRTGKTTLADPTARRLCESEGTAVLRHTDSVMHLGWSEASQAVSLWFDEPGSWVIEGVAVCRALRKWHAAHPDAPPPIDKVIRLTAPYEPLSKGQAAMAKGEETVWQEVAGWLYASGVPRPELVELHCEHAGHNARFKL